MTATEQQAERPPAVYRFTESVLVALVLGAGLAVGARAGATPLLVAIAVVQAVLAVAVLWGCNIPGRKGGLVLAALAAAGADVAVSVWPHSHLGTLLPVLGLAVPLLIAHQLMRGAARVRVVESLGGIAVVVFGEVALPALLQLRHEFPGDTGGKVVFAVVLVLVAALVVGLLADLVLTAPRFDADVPRGLPAVVLSAAAGALVGQLLLRDIDELAGGRGVFTGAALAVLASLVAVGVAFVERDLPAASPSSDDADGAGPSAFARTVRPALAVVVPIVALAPVAFLLCLAIRV